MLRTVWHTLCIMPAVTNLLRGTTIVKSSLNLGRHVGSDQTPHWPFLIELFWVALTSLAAGAALALAVDAAFFILAVFACTNLSFMALMVFVARRRAARGPQAKTTSDSTRESPSADPADDCSSFIVLPAHARADEMARVLFARQSYFPVAQGREVVGVVSKGRLLSALAHGQGDCFIAELMNHSIRTGPGRIDTALASGALLAPAVNATFFLTSNLRPATIQGVLDSAALPHEMNSRPKGP
jgi:hypothetical protein